jgi:hypothetical protein
MLTLSFVVCDPQQSNSLCCWNALRLHYIACFVARLGGVLGGKESQGWNDSSWRR